MKKPPLALPTLAAIFLGACANQMVYVTDSTPPALDLAGYTRIGPIPVQESGQDLTPELQEDLDQDPFGDQQEAVKIEWFKAGYYAGVKFGKSNLGDNSGDLADDLLARGHVATVDLENDDSTFSLYGGYRFAAPFSLELGWVNLGQVQSEISAMPANLNVYLNDVADVHPFLGKGVNFKGIFHALDTERVQLGLGLGLWAWDADVEAQAASGQIAEIDESGVDLNYSIQALISLGNGFSAVLSYEVFMLDDNEADVFWIGVQGGL